MLGCINGKITKVAMIVTQDMKDDTLYTTINFEVMEKRFITSKNNHMNESSLNILDRLIKF